MHYTYWADCTLEQHWVGYTLIKVLPKSSWKYSIITTYIPSRVVPQWAAAIQYRLVAPLKTEEKAVVTFHCAGDAVCFAAESILPCVCIAEVYSDSIPPLRCIQPVVCAGRQRVSLWNGSNRGIVSNSYHVCQDNNKKHHCHGCPVKYGSGSTDCLWHGCKLYTSYL